LIATPTIETFVPTQDISDADFALIGNMEKLESLQIGGVRLRGEQFKFLSHLNRLRWLTISTAIDEDSFSEIGKIRSLESISLSLCNPLSKKCLSHLDEL